MKDEHVSCVDCHLRRYLKDHKAWDRKTAARRWIQAHCPRGCTRGCTTKLSTANETRKIQRRRMNMFAQQARVKKLAKKKTA